MCVCVFMCNTTNVGPEFPLHVQPYSSFVMGEASMRTSQSSFECSVGKRIRATLGSAAVWGPMFGGDGAKAENGSLPPSATM